MLSVELEKRLVTMFLCVQLLNHVKESIVSFATWHINAGSAKNLHAKLGFEDKEIDELTKVSFLLDETDRLSTGWFSLTSSDARVGRQFAECTVEYLQ